MRAQGSCAALRAFTEGFQPVNHARIYQVPSFLAPSTRQCHPIKAPIVRSRRYVGSLAEKADATGDSFACYAFPTSFDGSISLPTPDPRNIQTWIERLDSFLPLELRSKDWLENLAKFEGIRPIRSLSQLLSRARAAVNPKMDLLSYVGIHQDRWNVVLWLVKTLTIIQPVVMESLDQNSLHQSVASFGDNDLDLDSVTSKPVIFERPELFQQGQTKPSLDEMTDSSQAPTIESLQIRDQIGQVLQAVGCMIVEATKQTEEASRVTMSYVYQILALLHTQNFIPHSLYYYEPAQDPSVLQRPPTLRMLSSRILSTLSDATWRAQEQDALSDAAAAGAEYSYRGYELPGARYKLRVHELGPEVWLEAVLWSCVEGGYVKEAAGIVAVMSRESGENSWSVINWDAIQNPTARFPPKKGKVDVDSAKRQVRGQGTGVLGSSIEGYSGEPPAVDMGPRTISSEVIAAIVDGLVTLVRPNTEDGGLTPPSAQYFIAVCKRLLEREKFGLESSSWNSIMIRMIESYAFDLDISPAVMEHLLDLAPTYRQELEALNSPDAPGSPAQSYVADYSAASLGLLHATLEVYCRKGNVAGALRTFKKLQNHVDTNRIRSMNLFGERVRLGIQEGLDDKDIGRASGTTLPGMNRDIPVPILALFLDLLSRARLHDLGRWLIYADDIDGPVISPALYGDPILQPTLLRFATSTADVDLLAKVNDKLISPISRDTLSALLHCQIMLGKWDSALGMIEYTTKERHFELTASDVMVIARKVLTTKPETFENGKGGKGQNILSSVLRGQYFRNPHPSTARDYTEARIRNQIIRILATLPEPMSLIAIPLVRSNGQETASISLPTEAFNILLEGVVERNGALAGQQFLETWSMETKETPSSKHRQKDAIQEEKVVLPDVQTLRIILRPLLQAQRQAADETRVEDITSMEYADLMRRDDLEHLDDIEKGKTHNLRSSDKAKRVRVNPSKPDPLLDWGVAMYKKLGLTNNDIEEEIPGYLSYTRSRPYRYTLL